MFAGISKKIIFTSLFFINFIQPSKSVDIEKFNIIESNFKTKLSKLITSTQSDLLLADRSKNRNELVIQSDRQSEINNVIYAEGNVLVTFKGNTLNADRIIYDKLNEKFD